MRLKISVFFILIIAFFASSAFSQDLENEGKKEEPDMDALRQWFREKRMITIKELGGDLSLSGEVRVEFQAFDEKKDGINQRGFGSPSGKPDYAFDVEVNIVLDYNLDRLWSTIKLEFDNDMGSVSGTTNRLALEKAYFGGRIIDGETFNFDGELGRRNLGNVFDSKIQFSSLFDGALLKFNKAYESIGSFYCNLGGFLVDDVVDHYGGVIEMGLLRIGNTGFYMKYSFIDWKKHFSDISKNERFNFANSQLQFGYQGTVTRFNKYLKVYFAGLINHLADNLKLANKTFSHRYDLAAYFGVSVGRIMQQGDWALDVNFQYVMPQAVPDFDSAGIQRGNAVNVGLYTIGIDGSGNRTTSQNAVGDANFKGFQFDFLYAISNNLTLLQSFEISNNQTFYVGPSMNYTKYEMEFIYAF